MPLHKYLFINGEDLRRLRTIKGLKQSAVAQTLGISQQAYSKIERCKNVGSKKAAEVLASFKCSLPDLDTIKNISYL